MMKLLIVSYTNVASMMHHNNVFPEGPLCRKTISKNLVFPGTIFEPGPEEIEQKLSESPGYTKRPSKKARMDDSAESDNEPDVDSKLVEEDQIEVSTKMRRMLESILRWKAESPDDKLIIYSQCKGLNYLIRHL